MIGASVVSGGSYENNRIASNIGARAKLQLTATYDDSSLDFVLI